MTFELEKDCLNYTFKEIDPALNNIWKLFDFAQYKIVLEKLDLFSVEIFESEPSVCILKAKCLFELGLKDESLRDLEHSFAWHKNDLRYLNQYAMLVLRIDRPDKSMSILKFLIAACFKQKKENFQKLTKKQKISIENKISECYSSLGKLFLERKDDFKAVKKSYFVFNDM